MAGTSVYTKEEYDKDVRTACKYGVTCYQTNPEHKKRFKHPPSKTPTKRLKDKIADERTSEEEELHAPKKARVEDTSNPEIKPQAKNSPSLQISAVAGPVKNAVTNKSVAECTDDGSHNKFPDEQELPKDPANIKDSIKQKFLVEMPDDFYKFWEFCKELEESDPLGALTPCGIRLVGAYDVLAGTPLIPRTTSRFLCHWRYYHDPPEMQTVLQCGKGGYHIGYFRDSPRVAPVFLASMCDAKPGKINPLAANIFDAVRVYCQEAEKTSDPFKKSALTKLSKQLEAAAKKHGFKLDTKSDALKVRKKRVVSRTFHGAGLVVPFDKDLDVGYREIPETDAALRRMFDKVAEAKTDAARATVFAEVQELMTNSQWATDEGDFGMGLELGLDMFLHGSSHLHKPAQHLMTVAYSLLQRDVFSTILEAHLKNRRKGDHLSAFD